MLGNNSCEYGLCQENGQRPLDAQQPQRRKIYWRACINGCRPGRPRPSAGGRMEIVPVCKRVQVGEFAFTSQLFHVGYWAYLAAALDLNCGSEASPIAKAGTIADQFRLIEDSDIFRLSCDSCPHTGPCWVASETLHRLAITSTTIKLSLESST